MNPEFLDFLEPEDPDYETTDAIEGPTCYVVLEMFRRRRSGGSRDSSRRSLFARREDRYWAVLQGSSKALVQFTHDWWELLQWNWEDRFSMKSIRIPKQIVQFEVSSLEQGITRGERHGWTNLTTFLGFSGEGHETLTRIEGMTHYVFFAVFKRKSVVLLAGREEDLVRVCALPPSEIELYLRREGGPSEEFSALAQPKLFAWPEASADRDKKLHEIYRWGAGLTLSHRAEEARFQAERLEIIEAKKAKGEWQAKEGPDKVKRVRGPDRVQRIRRTRKELDG